MVSQTTQAEPYALILVIFSTAFSPRFLGLAGAAYGERERPIRRFASLARNVERWMRVLLLGRRFLGVGRLDIARGAYGRREGL